MSHASNADPAPALFLKSMLLGGPVKVVVCWQREVRVVKMKLLKPNCTQIVLSSAVGLFCSVAGYLLNTEDFTDSTLSMAQIWLRIGMISAVGTLMGAYLGALATLSSVYYSRSMFLGFILILLLAMLFGVSLTAPQSKSEYANRSIGVELTAMLGFPAVLAVSAAALGYCLRRCGGTQKTMVDMPTNNPMNPSGGAADS